MDGLDYEYVFEPMESGLYQIRLYGEFIAYSETKDPHYADTILKGLGFNSRKEFVDDTKAYYREILGGK
jgi:hypothetical protein